MGRSFRIYLAGETVFVCRKCQNHLAVGEQVESKNFHGTHGTAYLIKHVVNCYVSDTAADREMRTGKHTVRDVFCGVCDEILGWRYDYAFELEQKYKEGKFILECELITERPESKARDPVFRPRIEEIVRESTRPDAAGIAQQIPILNRG